MRAFIPYLLIGLSVLSSVSAQSTGSVATVTSQVVSTVLTTSLATITTLSRSGDVNVQITTAVPTVLNVTTTIMSSNTASATPAPIVLETKLDPAFGVLGALLILSGLPSAFWGHKNRWTSFFLIGFYTLSLICLVLILKFGVLPAVNPPSKTLRGMFVLSCTVAGVVGGAVAIFFWKGARYFIGGWGGFAFALWVQCFRNGGLITPVGPRWIFYIGFGAVGFVLCTIPKIHYHVLLASTAFVGASAFMLGVDCYTTAGLKEFYLWNIGFANLFPKFTNNGIPYPVSPTIQIELGLMGAVALMGIAVQLRILTVLQKKLREIALEQQKRDEEAELDATERFAGVMKERDQWEKDHPTHGRTASGNSTFPLMGEGDASTPASEGRRNSDYTHSSGHGYRPPSGLSNYRMTSPIPIDDINRAIPKRAQSPGALPALDLGLGIQEDVPKNFITEDSGPQRRMRVEKPKADPETLRRREELVSEIQNIRQSIEALKGETSSSEASRRPSMKSRRTLSHDTGSMLHPTSHLRPPQQQDPRQRVQSMGLSTLSQSHLGEAISRSSSAPLRDEDWNAYVRDRKLLQPPSGITAPIATTPINPRISMPSAVAEALHQRRQRESILYRGGGDRVSYSSSSEDIPLAKMQPPRPAAFPVTILPPRKTSIPIVAPTPQRPDPPRTRTFEELVERHREKMRDMQAPLAQAEKEQAEILAARSRWERSKVVEMEAVNKRLAEKAAALSKDPDRRKSIDGIGRATKRSMTDPVNRGHKHSRTLSADKLNSLARHPSSSRRISTMKVEDWQRYQGEVAEGGPVRSPSKRISRASAGTVPFPGNPRTRNLSGFSRHQRMSVASRDPPS